MKRVLRVVCTSALVAVISSLANAQVETEHVAPVQLAQYPGAPLEDQHGNLWFSTVLNGLIRFDGSEFVTYTKEDGLGSNMIRDRIEAEDGTLWFATSGGLTKYDGESFTTLTEYEPITITRGWSDYGNHRDIWDVHIDRNDDLWIATLDGVFKHDGEEFVRFPMPVLAPKEKSEFAPSMVYCIYEDREGDLWFGTDGAGVVRYDGEKTVVYTMKANGLSSDNVCEILQDSRGDFWFGTSNGGLSKFDGKAFTTHLRNKEFSEHTGWGRFMSIHEDRNGDVWFGVSQQGGGVYRYDGNSFEYMSTDKGLGAGGVPSIREDRSGNMWFGTTTGVYHFDGERFINFTKSNPQLPTAPLNLDDWAPETFALPPGFAPELPVGSESLLFPPGWRDPDSENFWSYAFVMTIDEQPPEATRIQELLELYYDGLMSVFASGKEKESLITPTKVVVNQIKTNQYEANMHLVDAFATFEPVDIRVRIETVAAEDGHSQVRVQISRQPDDHQIWKELSAAIEHILESPPSEEHP